MKNIFVTLLLLVMPLISWSISNRNVPPILKNALCKQFPVVTDLKWHKYFDEDRNTIYEASFIMEGSRKSIIYSIIGQPIELEEEINHSDYPEHIKNQIKLKGFKSGYKAYNYELNNTYYQVTYKHKNKYTEIVFDQEGNIIETLSYTHNFKLGCALFSGVIVIFALLLL